MQCVTRPSESPRAMTEKVMTMDALANEIEERIKLLVPKSETLQKYGGTLFTLHPDQKEGQFCGVFIYKKHVQISFSRGSELKDPNKLLQGSGKVRKHVNITSAQEASSAELNKLIKQAAKL